MSLASEVNRNNYVGNGAVDTYDYTFKIFLDADLQVVVLDPDTLEETVLTLDTHYTVDGATDAGGGSISLVPGAFDWLDAGGDLEVDWILAIRRVLPLKQETDIRNQGTFYPEIHEKVFDILVMQNQQQQDELDRSIKLPTSMDPADFLAELPADLVGQSNVVIMTNEDGDGFAAGPTADAISGAQADAEAAEASQIAAAASAVEAGDFADDASDSADLAQLWATETTALVEATDNSAKAYAIGGTGAGQPSGGDAKSWAQLTGAAVTAALYSAKEWAIGTFTRGAANGGSSKDWANYTGGTVDNTEYSAKYYAAAAAAYITSILSNNNTWTGTNFFNNLVSFFQVVDAATTGADQSITLTKVFHVLTNASLASINNIASPSDGKFIILSNKTGANIVIKNNTGGTAANRIFTGTGGDLSLKTNAALILIYDANAARWQVVGGSGGGSNVVTSSLALAGGFQLAINTNEMEQTFLVQGLASSVAANPLPFGSTPPPDGAKIHLVGNDDTNTVIIPQNDAANGCLMDGDREIAKGQVVSFMYLSTLSRYVRMLP